MAIKRQQLSDMSDDELFDLRYRAKYITNGDWYTEGGSMDHEPRWIAGALVDLIDAETEKRKWLNQSVKS